MGAGTIGVRGYSSCRPTRRTFYYLGLIFSGRVGEWRRARKVHEAAVDLAFTKRLSRYSYAAPQGHNTRHLRERIRQLRGGPGRSPQPAT